MQGWRDPAQLLFEKCGALRDLEQDDVDALGKGAEARDRCYCRRIEPVADEVGAGPGVGEVGVGEADRRVRGEGRGECAELVVDDQDSAVECDAGIGNMA